MQHGWLCCISITFAFADSALAFASNSHGRLSLLLNASMSYPASVKEGDILKAVAVEESLTNKVGIYTITVFKDTGEKVGIFQGTVYRTQKEYLSIREA